MLNFLDPETVPPAPRLSLRAERRWRLALFLIAAFLRLILLTTVPPGLTHDEADHGLSAWGVVQGERPIYFTVGYGREPLYDYVTAGLMASLGPTFFAQRLVSVFFSLLTLAATYVVVRKLTHARVALLVLAGLAVGFWPLMVARQALRTITLLPFLLLAVYLWLDIPPSTTPLSPTQRRQQQIKIGVAGLLLGATFYTYLPARLMWLLFPVMLAVLWLTNRPLFDRLWRRTAVILAIAVVVSAPLFYYLATNATAEVRVGEVIDELTAAQNGEPSLFVENIFDGFRIIGLRGDGAWRYNVAERPLLPSFFAFFFVFGLWLSARAMLNPSEEEWSLKESHILFALWFLLGLAPVLVTGSFLSTTRAIGIMPVLYVYPALLVDWIWRRPGSHTYALTTVVCLYAFLALDSAQAYFFEWATHAEVRLHHEQTLVAAVDYLNEQEVRDDLLFSVDAPGRFHDQPVGLLTLHDDAQASARWFHGERGLVLPATPHLLVSSDLAPLTAIDPALLADFATEQYRDSRPESDIDRHLVIWKIEDAVGWREAVTADFVSIDQDGLILNDALTLHGYRVTELSGGQLLVQTWWEVVRPVAAETVLFTQFLGADGTPLGQADQLDVPSNAWVSGDHFVQNHWITLPESAAWQSLPLVTGLYDLESFMRWPVSAEGEPAGDLIYLQNRPSNH